KIADQAESLEDPKVVNQAESLEDPKIADQVKNKIIKQAESQNVDQFLKNWLEVDVNDERSIEKFGEKMEDLIKYKYKQRTLLLPLRWIILRSLVVSLDSKGAKVMILRKSFIIQKAIELEMTKKEIDNFLKTFTDFGSILYMPQYEKVEDIVIVNIWEFTQYLDKLYYPQEKEPYAANLLKYGIISESSVKKIFCKHPESADDFMTVLTTIAMASKIKSGKSILIDDQQQPDEVHYYLPLARTRAEYTPPEEENDYAFIEIESVNFPANVQACISYAIMDNNKDAALIATDYSNISRFLFQSESGPPISIEMVYKGSKTRLRIMNSSSDILSSPATVKACKKVITGSCRCLQRKINTIRDLKYSFAVPCASPEGGCHFLYHNCEPQLCDACSAENNFRLCWSKAAKQCELLSKGSEARMNENKSLKFEDISSIITNKYDFDALKKALNIDESKLLISPEDDDSRKKAMMWMLLLWEGQTENPTKYSLLSTLRENGCDSIAVKLESLNSQKNDQEIVEKKKSLLEQDQFSNKKTVSVSAEIPSIDNLECLSDVQVAEKKLFLIQGDKPQLMNWEKYGLRIGVQEGSLLSSETVEAAVVALVGGQFQFPPNTVLVSAVYAVSLSKPLLKRLKLEIQHCVDLTGQPDLAQYLKFAIAPMSTPSLPYQFKLVEGGEFSSNGGYGFIERKDFCLVCILGLLIVSMTGGGGGGGGQQQQGTGSQGAGIVPAQGGNAPVPHQQPVVNPQIQGEQSQEGDQSQSQEGEQEQGGDALTVLAQQQQSGANEQTNGQQGEEGQERQEKQEQSQQQG
uniref:Death domain-containing protein n=1 Tax=Amphimedon queenslandica TaxID=400682 RepID=A0A1X7UC80_AMPQE